MTITLACIAAPEQRRGFTALLAALSCWLVILAATIMPPVAPLTSSETPTLDLGSSRCRNNATRRCPAILHEDRNPACYKPIHSILPSEPCRNAARRRPTILDEEGNLAWPAAAPGAAASAGNTATGASAAELAAALAAVSEGSSSAGAAKRAARESAEAADADVFEMEILAWGQEVQICGLASFSFSSNLPCSLLWEPRMLHVLFL